MIPAKKGTGAVKYYLMVIGTIGIVTFYHLNGNTKDMKAYIANPKIVFDWDTNITCLSYSKALKTVRICSIGKNLNMQYRHFS